MADTDNTLKKASFIEAFVQTQMISEACKRAGISRSSAYRWRQQDEQFALDWADAEQRITDILEAAAVKRAVSGSDTLLIFLLKARKPDVYRENVRVVHGGQVQHRHGTDLAKLSPEELEQLERLVDRASE